jgi:MFS family permease
MSAASPSPTRVRYSVLGFACSLSMITYLDRVCFGKAAIHIADDLKLSGGVADLRLAFTTFTLAYAIFEVPTGWLGDVFGPKRTIMRIVLWWSVFTALTGTVTLAMGGLILLAVIRFLFGMGEAGAYPNITRALHNWLPPSKRAFGQGMVWMCGRLMGGLTPLVWLLVVEKGGLDWRQAFYLFGLIGVLWCVAFGLWFRDRPRDHPAVSAAEVELIEAGRTDIGHAHANVPWGKLLGSGNLWCLCLMYFCAAYGWYFNITYLPEFLEKQYEVEKTDFLGQLYAGGPLIFGAMTCLIGGLLSDWFIRRTGNRKWGRRLFGVIGHSLCALCYAVCALRPSLLLFVLAISMAAFWNDLTMGAAWATCQDIGRKYSAIVAGCMNTIGNLGGAAAGWITGEIVKARQVSVVGGEEAFKALSAAEKRELLWPAYDLNFLIFACVYVVAVFFWMRVDATKPVAPEASDQPEAHG